MISSGERKWREGRYGYGQLLLAGEALVVLTEEGETDFDQYAVAPGTPLYPDFFLD